MSEPTDVHELVTFYKFRADYYRDLSVALRHENQALRENIPENLRTKGITYQDRTGDTAVARAGRTTRQNRK
jgi:hypothetical protein